MRKRRQSPLVAPKRSEREIASTFPIYQHTALDRFVRGQIILEDKHGVDHATQLDVKVAQ